MSGGKIVLDRFIKILATELEQVVSNLVNCFNLSGKIVLDRFIKILATELEQVVSNLVNCFNLSKKIVIDRFIKIALGTWNIEEEFDT